MTPPPALSGTRRTRLAWIAAIAFASGFPFGLINETLPVYLRTEGAGLVEIGLISAMSFPWTFKFAWAPLVDRLGSRRGWIAVCLAALAALTLLLGALDMHRIAAGFWLLVVAMVALSATQDIAIDAYTIESTTAEELGVANSVRIACYRVAMFAAGGLLIWIAGRASWHLAFVVGAALLGALAAASSLLPGARSDAVRRESLWEPVRALLARPGIWAVIVFALLFKLDISALEPMTRPFWVDSGLSLETIGVYVTTGRIVATVTGAVLGGIFTTRYGIMRSLWVLGAIQAASSLGYAGAAVVRGMPAIVGAALFENFTAGMGTAAFLAYLMSVCERRYAATQFAMLSALLALTRTLAGAASGVLAGRLGYAEYFVVTFLMGLPAFALIPLLRRAGRGEDVAPRADASVAG